MKHFVKSLVLFSFLLINCNEQEANTFSIEGITDFTDEKIIYMLSPEGNMTIPVDSAKIVNGKFKMNGKVSSPNLNYLSIDGLNIPFILENGNIKAKIYKDSISVSKFSGTISNEDFYIFNQKSRELSNSYNDIIIEMNQANNLGDDILVTDLQDQAKLLQQKFFIFQKNFMRENINSYISALILEGFAVSQTLPVDSLKLIYNGLTERIKRTSSGNNIESILFPPLMPTDVGQIAPMFSGPNPEGEILQLKDLMGKITLIDFWAAWCRPCRIENPNLVKLYKEMNSKGLEIVGVSLDRDMNSWRKAIEDDGLMWSQISNLQFWQDPIAKLYNISAIPAAFLIDSEGRILAKNLRGERLKEKVKELLN